MRNEIAWWGHPGAFRLCLDFAVASLLEVESTSFMAPTAAGWDASGVNKRPEREIRHPPNGPDYSR